MKSTFNFLNNSSDKGQIGDLIFDENLRKLGYQIYFVIDTYDIIEFFFPFQSNKNETKRDKTEFLSKYLAYHYLFYEYKYKPIIPDEYLNELASFKFYLKKQIKKSKEAYNSIKTLLEEPTTNFDKNKTSFIEENIDLILAISLNLLTPNDIKKYDNLINERLNIFEIDLLHKKDETLINEIFKDASRSSKTREIFEEYYDTVKYSLVSKNVDKRERHLDNAVRDVIVIDRCLQINKRVMEEYKDLNGKYLFLYLSSTPFKSTNLFKLDAIKKEQSRIIFPEKVVQKKQLNLLRNSYQLLIQSSIDIDADNGEMYLKTLEEYEEMNVNDEILENFEKGNDENFGKELKETLSKSKEINSSLKDRILNQTRLSKFFKFKEEIKIALEGLTNNKDVSEFKKIFNEITTDRFDSSADSVLNYLMAHNQSTHIYNKLLSIIDSYSDDTTTLIIPDGNDLVRSDYQQFPILLFYGNKDKISNKDYSLLIKHIGNYLSDPKKTSKNKISEFIQNISHLVEKLFDEEKKGVATSTIVNIILLYLNIVFPVVNDKESDTDTNLENEEYLIKRLEKLKLVVKHSRINSKVENEKMEVFFSSNIYLVEIDYLLVWLYRRQRRYEESINLCNDRLQNSTKNKLVATRFKHGKMLSEMSVLYEKIDTVSNDYLKSELLKSINVIDKIVLEYKKHEDNVLVSKTIIALLNSSCDILLKLYKNTLDLSFLHRTDEVVVELNEMLENISKKTNIKLTMKDFPAFLDTLSWYYVHKANSSPNFKNALEFKKIAQKYKNECTHIYTGKMYQHGIYLQTAIDKIKRK